jgi:hypothetical protein
MRLRPLEPTSKTATNILRLQRQLGIQVLDAKSAIQLGLIVLGDGTPDDQVVALLASKLNGKAVAGIVKPKYTGVGTIQALPQYTNFRRVAFIVDQEDKELDKLYKEVESSLMQNGFSVDSKQIIHKRVIHIRSTRGPTSIQIYVSFNGTDNTSYRKNTIENHFIPYINTLHNYTEAKDEWNTLREELRLEILRKIYAEGDLSQVFPQQLLTLAKLEEAFQ